jgi:hypothetical protein
LVQPLWLCVFVIDRPRNGFSSPGRVAEGGDPPPAPTDPDVRN